MKHWRCILFLVIITGLVSTPHGAGAPAYAESARYPAAGFVFSCTANSILISNGGTIVLQASFAQIAGPLQAAITSGQNRLIVSSGGVSLWALKSNELQVHYDSNPDATKVIVKSNICQFSQSGVGFLFQCSGTGINVLLQNKTVLQATFDQIAGPLYTAILLGQNRLIVTGGGISLWALKSNELQVHYDSNPDGTKLIVRSDICGLIALRAVTTNTPTTTGTVPAAGTPYTSNNNTPATAGRTTYVVQPGDNLFRISLRFGRSMDVIAAANGITNYALIYAGQVLVIP